jgi:hypothetical protein
MYHHVLCCTRYVRLRYDQLEPDFGNEDLQTRFENRAAQEPLEVRSWVIRHHLGAARTFVDS